MSHSPVIQLIAHRASGAAVVRLFAEAEEGEVPLRRPRPARSLSHYARLILMRVQDALMSQVPCEDITFRGQPARRKPQM